MSESKIRRKNKSYPFTLSTATSVAVTIPMYDMAGGLVTMGTVSTSAVAIQLFVAEAEAGPFRRLYDSSGAVADITLAPSTTDGRAYAVPDAAFAAPFIKFVSSTTNSTGTVGTVMFKG